MSPLGPKRRSRNLPLASGVGSAADIKRRSGAVENPALDRPAGTRGRASTASMAFCRHNDRLALGRDRTQPQAPRRGRGLARTRNSGRGPLFEQLAFGSASRVPGDSGEEAEEMTERKETLSPRTDAGKLFVLEKRDLTANRSR
jgi:hypothetical protein